jgi:hypothetical protein
MAISMINFLSLQTEANPAIAGLAHAHGSSYPLNGCTSALPFSVSLDSVNVGKIQLTQFILHSQNFQF